MREILARNAPGRDGFVFTLSLQYRILTAPILEVPAMPVVRDAAVRDTTINIRARRAQQELIDRAARLAGRNRSDFMVEAACERAQHLLLDRAFFGLDHRAY